MSFGHHTSIISGSVGSGGGGVSDGLDWDVAAPSGAGAVARGSADTSADAGVSGVDRAGSS